MAANTPKGTTCVFNLDSVFTYLRKSTIEEQERTTFALDNPFNTANNNPLIQDRSIGELRIKATVIQDELINAENSHRTLTRDIPAMKFLLDRTKEELSSLVELVNDDTQVSCHSQENLNALYDDLEIKMALYNSHLKTAKISANNQRKYDHGN